MIMNYEDLTDKRYGRWTVLQRLPEKGAARYLCRCDCGTERVVLARALKSGASQSCGCLMRETNSGRARNLTGMHFGMLMVMERAPMREGDGTIRWLCRCDCGNTCEVDTARLLNGKKTHCGCVKRKGSTVCDITDQKFGMLTALWPTEKRDKKGSVVWHCRCDCGNEKDVSYERLKYSDTISCGCRFKEAQQNIRFQPNRTADTCIDLLSGTKPHYDSKTGVRGVNLRGNKFVSQITFQRHTYYLGCFDRLEDATNIRRAAENFFYYAVKARYDAWQAQAQANPLWAESNPFDVRVERDSLGNISLSIVPAPIDAEPFVLRVKSTLRDLTGQRFGRLIALRPTDARADGGCAVWLCRCDCGGEIEVSSKRLLDGKVRSCGCLSRPIIKDFIGKRFGRLVVLEYVGKIRKDSSMNYWKCRCDCSNVTFVGQTELQNGDTISCGCYQKQRARDALRLIDGTSITILERNKQRLRSTNKSGYTGVMQENNGKWRAYITFKKKTYYLGSFDDKEDAVRTRQRAEEMHDDFVEWYYTQYPRSRIANTVCHTGHIPLLTTVFT